MIPERNKDLFIESIADRMTFEEACLAAQISRATLFRFLKTDSEFKNRYDATLFEVKRNAQKKADDENMKRLKDLIKRRK